VRHAKLGDSDGNHDLWLFVARFSSVHCISISQEMLLQPNAAELDSAEIDVSG
jgi:hypothetical protein